MKKLYVGKFKNGDQVDKNYYRIDDMEYYQENKDRHFSGLEPGDYVLPMKRGMIGKLLQFERFLEKESAFDAIFSVVKTYSPELSLIGNIVNCRFVLPDMNLLNKSIKSTKGIGFIPLALDSNSPDVTEIDFYKSKRRFFVCVPEKKKNLSFFKPADICIVVSDTENRSITDIVEFNGQTFVQNTALWNLYLEKTDQNAGQYSLQQLLNFAAKENDNAPNKQKYLTALLNTLTSDGIFVADNPIALYDNVIVGRKQIYSKKTSSSGNEDEIEYDLTDYEQYANLMAFNPNVILHGPPGTGKTYGAMKIIEAFEKQNRSDDSFREVAEQGRVRFITFHQAFSYEEFVEGIRPELDENGNMTYPVKPGVLREIADSCRIQEKKQDDTTAADLANTSTSNEVWRVSLGQKNEQHIYTALRDKNVIAVGYATHEDLSKWDEQKFLNTSIKSPLKMFFEDMNIGDIIMVFNDRRTIRLIGVITSDYFYSEDDCLGYPHQRKVKWLKRFEQSPRDIYQLNQEKTMSTVAVHRLNISIADAISLLDSPEGAKAVSQPYYLRV